MQKTTNEAPSGDAPPGIAPSGGAASCRAGRKHNQPVSLFAAALIGAGLLCLSGLPARAEMLTTWDFPEKDTPLTAESTNSIALLGLCRVGDATVLLYRNARARGGGGDSSAGADSATAACFLAAAALSAFSLGAAPRGAGASGALFTATDSAAPYDDRGLSTWGRSDAGGNDIGDGFGEWFEGDFMPTRTFRTDNISHATQFSASGYGTVGRAFENGVQLVDGKFTVSAEHEFFDEFSGFSVYSDDVGTGYAELLRWGLMTKDNTLGFCLGTFHDGFVEYELLQSVALGFGETFLAVDYEIAWQTYDGGLEFQVAATGYGFSFTSDWMQLAGAGPVSGVGVAVAGGSNDKAMLFDKIYVEGHAVPEPASGALLLLGAVVLAARRKKDAKK